jgi:hypothetical protein
MRVVLHQRRWLGCAEDHDMTDLEISKALALAIGWAEDDFGSWWIDHFMIDIGDDQSGYPQWYAFDYRDWNVIGPIAERYEAFPMHYPKQGGWFSGAIDIPQDAYADAWADTPQKAIALSVIAMKDMMTKDQIDEVCKPVEPVPQTYWMIECTSAWCGWYTGEGKVDCRFFNTDPHRGKRFATKEEAEAVICNSCQIATSHQDVDLRAAPAQPASEPQPIRMERVTMDKEKIMWGHNINMPTNALTNAGDTILCWVNEGDFCSNQLAAHNIRSKE